MATDRRVELSSVRNARSLGGLHAASGGTAHGVFCRSDVPLSLTEEDICVLRSYGITHVLNLRSEAEVQAHPSAAKACFEYLNVPLQGGDKIPQTREEVPASYLNMTMGTTQMARAMRFLADAPDGVLIHCTAGKDRTGVVCAILLMLAGVTDDAICEDYAQTEIYMEPVLVQLCAQNPALNFDALVARKENMQAFLIAFREKWGSAEEYLLHISLKPEQVERLKAKMTGQRQKNGEKRIR